MYKQLYTDRSKYLRNSFSVEIIRMEDQQRRFPDKLKSIVEKYKSSSEDQKQFQFQQNLMQRSIELEKKDKSKSLN